MRYCAECGKKLVEPDEKFCPECGADLSKETAVARQPSAAALPAKAGKAKPAAEEPVAGKRKSWFGVVLLILGALFLIGLVLLVLVAVVPLLFITVNGGGLLTPTLPTVVRNNIAISTNSSLTQIEYDDYCDKINPYDLSVRKAASVAIRKHPGAYNSSFDQLLDIYDWVKANIQYQNVPFTDPISYPAPDTLVTKSGDCKNQAVLMASMVQAIGGKAKVLIDDNCLHAYAIVYVGKSEQDVVDFSKAVAERYKNNPPVPGAYYNNGSPRVAYVNYDNGKWVIMDAAGAYYPGDTLNECLGHDTVTIETDCMSCANEHLDSPYTFNNSCYSRCPSGTVSVNQHACESCPEGYQSYNNTCLTCGAGKIVGSDGMCHTTCGDSNTYCLSGYTCYNGKCLACPSGEIFGADGLCHQTCGGPTMYCLPGSYCYNGRCYKS
jgi:hypothetical protein